MVIIHDRFLLWEELLGYCCQSSHWVVDGFASLRRIGSAMVDLHGLKPKKRQRYLAALSGGVIWQRYLATDENILFVAE